MHIFLVRKVIIHNIFVSVNENIFIDYTFLLYNGHSRVRLVVVEVKSMSDKKEFKHNNRLKELRKDKGLSQQALAQQNGTILRQSSLATTPKYFSGALGKRLYFADSKNF